MVLTVERCSLNQDLNDENSINGVGFLKERRELENISETNKPMGCLLGT